MKSKEIYFKLKFKVNKFDKMLSKYKLLFFLLKYEII